MLKLRVDSGEVTEVLSHTPLPITPFQSLITQPIDPLFKRGQHSFILFIR